MDLEKHLSVSGVSFALVRDFATTTPFALEMVLPVLRARKVITPADL